MSAVTYGAPTPVVEYVAPAPVDVSIAPIQALNTRPARVIEHVAHRVHCSCSNRGHNARSSHVPLDEYDIDLPAPASAAQHSASSPVCKTPAPVDDRSSVSQRCLTLRREAEAGWAERTVEELVRQEELEATPAVKKAKKGRHKR